MANLPKDLTEKDLLRQRANIKVTVSKMKIEAPSLPDLIIGMKEWLKTCENEDKLVARC